LRGLSEYGDDTAAISVCSSKTLPHFAQKIMTIYVRAAAVFCKAADSDPTGLNYDGNRLNASCLDVTRCRRNRSFLTR